MPAAAKGTGEKSAKAFARHYFDSINFAARTGRSKELALLGTAGCQSCVAIQDNINGIYSDGGHIEGGGWTLRASRAIQTTRTSAVLSIDAFLHPQVVVTGSGAEQSHDGGKQPMTMFLSRRGEKWLVSKLDLVS
jgi:hypothetical protein